MTLASTYLSVYNTASFIFWTYLTLRAALLAPSLYAQGRLHDLYDDLLFPLAPTQTLALIEVVHAATGIVRASPLTTAIQVGGKNLVVWTVMVQFPETIVGSEGQGAPGIWGFLGCVVCWGLSEIVRYGYFVALLTRGDAPQWLKWLRYSVFVPLYMPGMLSEAWLVFLSLTTAVNVALAYRAYLLLGLLSYPLAGYTMYSYMLSQRRRVLKQSNKKQ